MKKITFNYAKKGIRITINSMRKTRCLQEAKLNVIIEQNGEQFKDKIYIENGHNWYCNCFNMDIIKRGIKEYLDENY